MTGPSQTAFAKEEIQAAYDHLLDTYEGFTATEQRVEE